MGSVIITSNYGGESRHPCRSWGDGSKIQESPSQGLDRASPTLGLSRRSDQAGPGGIALAASYQNCCDVGASHDTGPFRSAGVKLAGCPKTIDGPSLTGVFSRSFYAWPCSPSRWDSSSGGGESESLGPLFAAPLKREGFMIRWMTASGAGWARFPRAARANRRPRRRRGPSQPSEALMDDPTVDNSSRSPVGTSFFKGQTSDELIMLDK
jgi:hypothetical protein